MSTAASSQPTKRFDASRLLDISALPVTRALLVMVFSWVTSRGDSFIAAIRPINESRGCRPQLKGCLSGLALLRRDTVGLVMRPNVGLGASGNSMEGSGEGKGRESSKGAKKVGAKPKRGSLIPGPPRLENVPQEKMDEVLLFREERPNR